MLEAEASRVEVVERVSHSTLAIFDLKGESGGSGVVISDDGYALTNFHVVAPCGPVMHCGTDDGRLHTAVLVGLDPTGDLALIKLLGEGPFRAAAIGDSDRVEVGDEALVVGNPFLLADDFRPSVSFGVVSGVGRYQYPSGSLLEYADCLQTDAAINPGNSGGPLFDAAGRLIGINGRGSFEKRGRVNVGVGYAVSINQAMRFLPQLKAGRIVDHASLGAAARTIGQGPHGGAAVVIDAIESGSNAERRGLRYGDEILRLGDRDTPSANALQNALGVLPARWPVLVELRRGESRLALEVRLAERHAPGELREAVEQQLAALPERGAEPAGIADWRPHYEAREGFANHHFNRLASSTLMERCAALGASAPGPLSITATDGRGDEVTVALLESKATWRSPLGRYFVRTDEPLRGELALAPPGSGGLLAGLSALGRLLAEGLAGFDESHYHGALPFRAGETPLDVIVTNHRGVRCEFYFESLREGATRIVGLRSEVDGAGDGCRVALEDWRTDSATGRLLPHRLTADAGAVRFAELEVDAYSATEGNER
ncbi:putative periplasmic serine endoprotease DegP-like precursor [Pseudobythopirellula maris]|uniref:Putative periplasmic serine endoprotease DegP-like n=1 Tax=Pseudobythopirellula maris TaxID=2527991 RepID=A0A5C5ZSB9_9BACT|nr:putative periplasmic serine endoprotease DegP-like precursor [Pseudobythopirellula maris]